MYTPMLFSLSALAQVAVFSLIILLSVAAFRTDAANVVLTGLWAFVYLDRHGFFKRI
jgi:hypothetical protein